MIEGPADPRRARRASRAASSRGHRYLGEQNDPRQVPEVGMDSRHLRLRLLDCSITIELYSC